MACSLNSFSVDLKTVGTVVVRLSEVVAEFVEIEVCLNLDQGLPSGRQQYQIRGIRCLLDRCQVAAQLSINTPQIFGWSRSI